MHTQILILSADAVFSRMLTIELEMQRFSVICRTAAEDIFADVLLMDLDTALPPSPSHYRHMIGFTRRSAAAGDEAGRRCSLVLRRPFEMRLLCREVSALLGERSEEPLRDVTVDFAIDGSHVRLSDGTRRAISPQEAEVLSLLLERRGETVSREEISARIGESSANKVDVYVCYLRKKLETPERRVIATVRGRGYRLL